MNAQQRARAIWQEAKNHPSPVGIIHPASLVLEDFQARSGGHWAHVSCAAHEHHENVIAFAIQKTGLDGWLVRTGSPYWRDEKWNWQLVK